MPVQTRNTFQRRSGAGSPAEARERAAALTLEDAAARITGPLLVAAGGRDRLVPPYHAERLAREAPGAELMLYPDGSHGLTNHAFESPAAVASANSRSANPPPLPSRAPSCPAATQPITTRSTGDRSASVTRRAERLAPLIEAALRGGSLRWAGSRAKNGSGSASRG